MKNLLYLLVLVFFLPSCAPTKDFGKVVTPNYAPVTQGLLKGVPDSKKVKLQYWNDRDIVLERSINSQTKEVAQGKLILREGSSYDRVILKANTPGILQEIDNEGDWKVSFEEGYFFWFAFNGGGLDKHCQLVIERNEGVKSFLVYGLYEYEVVEGPVAELLLDLTKLNNDKSHERTIGGRTLNGT